MNCREVALADVAATEELGRSLARALQGGAAVIYLQGELGTGKTSLVRSLLRGMGHTDRVRSPTYTLVETYSLAGRHIFHLDLYRVGQAEELEYLGLRDLDPEHDLLLVEWPERGAGALPAADLRVELDYAGQGRQARLMALSRRGDTILSGL
jgi:tRNA threonylcarbamoyladenosine biosynthesis protein TsaE